MYKLNPNDSAAAFAIANDTPSVAFAPNFDLLSVPSISNSLLSIFLCSYAFMFFILGAILVFTFSTAFCTPFPKYLCISPSLNSTASKLPVEAPEGTMLLPQNPPSKTTSTCTVGFPLESNTSRAFIFSIPK